MYEKELQVAIKAVKDAENIFKKYHGKKPQVKTKDHDYRNLVSLADKTIELQIKKYLRKIFPSYGFLGEEYGDSPKSTRFSWVLDPIDGTSNYLHGLPDCAISLALLKADVPIVGVVSGPNLNRFYTARKGGGARLNGKLIKVSSTKTVKEAFGGTAWGRDVSFPGEVIPKLVDKVLKLRAPGVAALPLCYVAQGNYDFFLDRTMKIWDWAAGKIILEEAGGSFTITSNKMFVATNKILSKSFVNFLESAGL